MIKVKNAFCLHYTFEGCFVKWDLQVYILTGFSTILTNGNSFCDFLFVSLDNEALQYGRNEIAP